MSDSVLSQFTPTVHEEEKSVGRELKFGIIGAGWIAESYALSIKDMPDIRITAVADIIEGKAQKFIDRYGIDGAKAYPDHTSLLENEELDAVCVCTYNVAHAEPTIAALEKGLHVILEKPMSVTLDEAVEIVRAEKKSGKILTIGFQPRMDENMKMIKKIVESGELGKVYYIQTGGGRRRGIPNSTFIEKETAGIGALGDIGCYSLDMVLNAIGYPKPLTVSAYTSDFFGSNPKYNNPEDAARFDVDDFAAAFIRLEGDIVVDFRIAWAMHLDTPGDTVILGTEGALRIPSTECWNGSVGGPMRLYKDVAGQQVDFEIPLAPEPTEFNGLFTQKIRAFAEAIRNEGKSPIPTDQIILNQAILDGIAKSAELKREIEIEIPEI